MNNLSKTMRTKAALYTVPALVICAVLVIVYGVNNIFPFGSGSVVFDDMGQTSVPLFTAFWDVLHGDGSALFNWNTGTGVYIGNTMSQFLSPLTPLFFLICPRGMIASSMSFFVMLKLVLMTLSMMFFLDKTFKISSLWKIIFSILYPFSGYVFQLYTNIDWLDIAIFFPLLIVAFKYLTVKGKFLPYVIILALCSARSLYLSYMIFLFLILVGGLYIIMLVPKVKRKSVILNFGIGSVSALLISAAFSLPTYFYLTSSSRYEKTKGFVDLLTTEMSINKAKIGMIIIMAALPIAIIGFMLMRFLEEKRKITFFILALCVLGVQVVFENINLIWHMGSYVLFPMRYAFMFSFVLLAACAFAIERFGKEIFKGKGVLSGIMMAFSVALAGFAAYLVFSGKVFSNVMNSGYKYSTFYDNAKYGFLFFLILALCYFLLLNFGKKRIGIVLMCIVLMLETGIYANRAFTPTIERKREYGIEFIDDCNQINEKTQIETDNMSRIKNTDSSMNSNYPLLLNHSSPSNFTHIIPSSLAQTMKKLGYSTIYTRILDTGGSLLTDAILNYEYTLTQKATDDEAYTFVESIGDYNIYENKFKLPFGFVVNDGVFDDDLLGGNAFEVNNKIYKILSGDSEDIIETKGRNVSRNTDTVEFKIEVEGTKKLYYLNSATGWGSQKIYVNGEVVGVPTMGNIENTSYKATFNNNLIDLGTFSDTNVSVSVKTTNNKALLHNAVVGVMDIQKLADLCKGYDYDSQAVAEGRNLDLTVNSKGNDNHLFLPMVYYSSWACTVNGEKVEPKNTLGSFMAIELDEGVNAVSMKFTPKGLSEGIIISAVSIALLAAYLIFRKYKPLDPESSSLPLRALEGAYIIITAGVFVLLYVVPVFYSLVL
ncbi:MAG TPA: YfhO family protein [Clostridia bacterium]|nr:YfhO family protein [Clostridia bacterium]